MAPKNDPPKAYNDKLPDVNTWLPKKKVRDNLREAFLLRCQHVEELLLLRVKIEKKLNIENYDAGAGIEDILREELANILPQRYAVRAGTINDRLGYTAGDNEIIILNQTWFPAVKAGATNISRKIHFPIESVYGVIEVKQSLDFAVLDEAMKKLVTCSRLYRPSTSGNRITENTEGPNLLVSSPLHTTNPLYTAIVATGILDNITMKELVNRFYLINKSLGRSEMVHALCVLGEGTVHWGYINESGDPQVALFMDDLDIPLTAIYHEKTISKNAFFAFMSNLLEHLRHSTLDAEGIHEVYGGDKDKVSIIRPSGSWLPPDIVLGTGFLRNNQSDLTIIAHECLTVIRDLFSGAIPVLGVKPIICMGGNQSNTFTISGDSYLILLVSDGRKYDEFAYQLLSQLAKIMLGATNATQFVDLLTFAVAFQALKELTRRWKTVPLPDNLKTYSSKFAKFQNSLMANLIVTLPKAVQDAYNNSESSKISMYLRYWISQKTIIDSSVSFVGASSFKVASEAWDDLMHLDYSVPSKSWSFTKFSKVAKEILQNFGIVSSNVLMIARFNVQPSIPSNIDELLFEESGEWVWLKEAPPAQQKKVQQEAVKYNPISLTFESVRK